MGIRNRDGALYSATGIDNSGLYAGRREAIGIIKAMAGEITSFDVFSGIGISAATAFAKAAKSSYDFEKEFRKNMLEVATISTQVTDDMTGFMNQVMSITQEIPVTAPEAAKALYQIVSAGHDGAAGMHILEISAKSAIGGMTDTATAADAITTLINAYKLSAEDADMVSDQLFTTARLGKTTFGELGQSIAQVAPVAAAYGVEMDQVLAAVATLTKSGTPTAQAMTQIRASIIAASKELGDGAFEGRTFQEALELIAKKANGSEAAIRDMITEVEAQVGILALTGEKAKDAAADLDAMNKSAGATEAAFKKMMEDVDKQMILLSNNIQASLRPMGQAILKEVSEVATAFNEALKNGEAKEAMKSLGGLIVIVMGAFIGYKGSIIATTAAQNAYTKALAISRLASIQQITTTQLLTNSIKAQTAAMLKNIVALATNPYVLAAAAIAALGYGIYRYATQATAAEKAMAAHNKRVNDLKALADDTTKSAEGLLSSLRDENVLMTERVGIYEKLKDLYPSVLDKISLENFLLMDSVEANNLLAKSLDERIKAQQKADVNTIEAEMKANNAKILGLESKKSKNEDSGDKSIFGELTLGESFELDKLKKRNEQLQIEFDKARAIVVQGLKDETAAKKVTSSLDLDNESGKTVLERKIQLTKDLAEANANLNKLRAPSSTAKNTEIQAAEDKVKEIKGKLEALTGSAMKGANTLASEQSDRLRAIEDYRKSISDAEVQAELDIRQQRIEAIDEGSKKELAMIQLNHDRMRDANRKRANEMIKERQELERKQWEYDNPGWKEKGMAFKPTTTSVRQLSKPQQGQLLAYDDLADIQRQKATKDLLDKERQAMDEYLKEYGTYLEKRQAITELYNDKIAKAFTGGEKMSLKRQLADELKSLDLSGFKESINFAEVFGNLDNLTPDSITRLRDKLKEYINKAASGLRPEDLRELSDALSNIEIKTAEKNPFGEIGKGLEDYKRATEGVEDAQERLNYVMAGGEIITGLYEDGTGKLCKRLLTQEEAEANLVKAQDKRAESLARMNTALAAGVGKAQEYVGVATAMFGALDSFGVEVPEQLTGFIDGMGKTLDSLASIDLNKPLSVVTGAIGAIGGLGKAIGSLFNNDSKKQKNIERLQEQVDVLDKSYEKLGDSIGKAYSKDASGLIDQQNKLLEQQKVLIQQQIAEEEDKKNTDDDRIKEWRDQMGEIDKTLADNKEKAKDAIFGEDLKSAIDNFASAYAEAWASGEDRAKSAKDTVRNMMRQMVTESIKAAMDSSGAMERIRTKLEEFYADNILQGWEQDYIYNMAEGLQRELDDKYGWADSLMRDDTGPKDGVSGQLQAAMTEGTASQLVGLWNSTSIDMRELKQISLSNGETVSSILSEVTEMIRQGVLIEQNTRRGADNTDGLINELQSGFNALDKRLYEIERNTKVSKSRG